MDIASRDPNRVTSLQGVDSLTFTIPTNAAVNPSTHALLVEGTVTPSGTQDVNLTQVGGVAFSLGQQLAAASLPIVLTASQLSTLTPLSTVAVTQSTSPWVVSGTVTANQGGTWNIATLTSITNPVTVTGTIAFSNTTIAVTNAGVFAVQASQSGTWNINNISGTISLPTGASTLTEQQTQTTALGTLLTTSAFQARINTLGQKTMVSSTPVVLASDQSAIPVTVTSTTITGTVAVTQSTSPWIVAGGGTAGSAASGVVTIQGIASMTPVQVSQATGTNLHTVIDSGVITTVGAVTAITNALPTGSNTIGAVEIDGTALTNGQVTIDTTSGGVSIVAASPGRQGVLVKNQGAITCYVGTGTVSTSNGVELKAGEAISIPTDDQVKAITASSTTTVGYLALA